MVTKENALQWAGICKWIADGECQFLNSSGEWVDLKGEWSFMYHKPEDFRRSPSKVTRHMTVEEVIKLGYFVRKWVDEETGKAYYASGLISDDESSIELWVKSGNTYTTDGGKSWRQFTVEEEAK